jgi:hypothetical protein
MMDANRFKEIQKDVASHFESPAALLGDGELDAPQKAMLLKQWEYDLRQMMVASEENMTDQTAAQGESGELLRGVRTALGKLEEAHPELAEDAKVTPAKAGGAVN